METFTAVGL